MHENIDTNFSQRLEKKNIYLDKKKGYTKNEMFFLYECKN